MQKPPTNGNSQLGIRRQFIAQQQTLPQQVPFTPPPSSILSNSSIQIPQSPTPVVPLTASIPIPSTSHKKRNVLRIIAALLVLGLAGAIYFIWNTTVPTTTTTASSSGNQQSVTQQSFSAASTPEPATDGIRVYVVGAVKNPGIYTLASGARVYDLLQAAGGPLPSANLVVVNLAAKLSDGQEVYITQIGETPPSYSVSVSSASGGKTGTGVTSSSSGGNSTTSGSGADGNTNGQLVNINTASVDELSKGLHISKKTAQTIVDYRTQNGDFSSVDQLAQVVSHAIYTKIKAECTV